MAIRKSGWFVIAGTVLVFLIISLSPHALPAGSRYHGHTAFGWLNKPQDEEYSEGLSAGSSAGSSAESNAGSGAGQSAEQSAGQSAVAEADEEAFSSWKMPFQWDLPLDNPNFDVRNLRRYKPHNYQGPGHETFATYFATRNGTTKDPYFMAAQQLAYRVLWHNPSKSNKHPLTVFVAPFIDDEKRDLLRAAGALVRELDLLAWHPAAHTEGRWRDLFSKLNMWAQTDFSRIAFLDIDAFPMQNIDSIFDLATPANCKKELLPTEDKPNADSICKYTFAGTPVFERHINVGVMVFDPNMAMFQRLVRESTHTEKFDNTMAEQAFLNWAYREDGPFPSSLLEREWNGFFPQESEHATLKIVHEKLWAANEGLTWAQKEFNDTWDDMLTLYESEQFTRMRELDGQRLY